jgi:hypothetical protein
MAAGGKYAELRDEFAADKTLAASISKAVQAAGKYGADRLAVSQNYESRGLDMQQLEARFGEADKAIGDSLSKIPGKDGKSTLDDLAERAAEIFRKAMEKVRDFMAPKQEAMTIVDCHNEIPLKVIYQRF